MRWGIFAACAAFLCGAAPAAADEASAVAAMAEHTQFSSVGIASYYGAEFHGRRTADGEIFDMHGLTAAHKTLPIPCYARVTNLDNGRSIVVRINVAVDGVMDNEHHWFVGESSDGAYLSVDMPRTQAISASASATLRSRSLR